MSAQYLLVIYPYGDLQDKLLDEQQQFVSNYFSGDYGLKSTPLSPGRLPGPIPAGDKPHITIAVFRADESMEDTLIRWIQRICNRYRSFETALNNYSGFPPHFSE